MHVPRANEANPIARNLGDIANRTVDDRADTTAVGSGGREQLAPDSRPHGSARRRDQNIIRLASIDGKQLQLVGLIIFVRHVRPERRLTSAGEGGLAGITCQLNLRRLVAIAKCVQRVAQDGGVKMLAHHREGDRVGCMIHAIACC